MARRVNPLTTIRKLCLAFPDSVETETWGKPHFRVKDKIFAGFGDEDGVPTLGFKLEMDHAAQVIKIPGFRKAKYVGHKGWVSMDVSDVQDWSTVAEMLEESYRLIAPKRSLAQLDGNSPEEITSARKTVKKKTATKSQSKASPKTKRK